MGSAIANALTRGRMRVLATLSGRSERTARLAERAGVELLRDLASVVREADAVLSIVPPEAAEAVVADISEAARSQNVEPLVADLNAIAPSTARRAEAIAAEANCHFVDGAISGPPPWNPGTTRLYLSGPRARELAALPFDGVETVVVGDVGAAPAREDEHGLGLQGQRWPAHPRAPRRGVERRPRVRARRPAAERSGARGTRRTAPRARSVEIGSLRR